jgi:hypothetical protein
MNPIIVAIDPGANGGVAWEGPNGLIAAENLPSIPADLVDMLSSILTEGPVVVYMEEVGGYTGGEGMPGSSAFNFGKGFGVILGICAALRLPIELVRPQKWQKALSLGNSTGMTKTQWKNKLKDKACQLYPAVKVTLKTSDALLILNAATKKLI